MTSNLISPFFFAQPFEPFAIHVADGRVFEIRHPDFATVSEAGLGVWILHSSGALEIVDTSLICSIRTLGPANLDQFSR
jgi:hypothetical protein